MIRRYFRLWLMYIICTHEEHLFSANNIATNRNSSIKHLFNKDINNIERIKVNIGIRKFEQDTIVALHNMYRTQVTPSASKMLKIKWNWHLAELAKKWGDRCQFGFGPSKCKNIISQNMDFDTPSYRAALAKWNDEKYNYDYASNNCDIDASCHHYKTITWAKTHSIGCSQSKCGTNGSINFFICNYYPAADLSEQPYTKGFPCSNCTEECIMSSLCDTNLVLPKEKLVECSISPSSATGLIYDNDAKMELFIMGIIIHVLNLA
ncbi:serotriflin-like isoform X1 [Centruroides vittatus]|uniref:serotriflin-like isoform X1 n=1 Tax=Centruroides vittatus TaxID=120091 RepID=UPI00350EE17D